MMDWILIILFHLVYFAVCGGFGLLVVILINYAFENITGYIRTGTSQTQLEREFKKIEDKELTHELRQLLAERRMLRFWKLLVLFIVASVTYAVTLLLVG